MLIYPIDTKGGKKKHLKKQPCQLTPMTTGIRISVKEGRMDPLSIASTAIGGISAIGDLVMGGLNYANQKEQQQWERNKYEQALSREDSAIQRRVADLKAAGLSPVLAAGSGATTMAPIKSSAPQFHTDAGDKALQAITVQAALMQQKANIAKTAEETQLIKLQKDRVLADTVGQQLANNYLKDSMGNRLSKLDLEVQLAKLTNPTKVQQMAVDLNRSNIKYEQDKVDLELKKLGVKQSELNLILSDLKKRFSTNQLQGQQEDIIAKQIARELLRTQSNLLTRQAQANSLTSMELLRNIHEILKMGQTLTDLVRF